MSNSLGIATVTSCLKAVLENAFTNSDNADDSISSARVTTVIPLAIPDSGLPDVGANVFLYQVTPNAAGRNDDLPNRNSRGDTVGRPRVAVDLHYIITFYGTDTLLEPQRLMGLTLRTLHRKPVFSPTLVTQAIAQVQTTNPGLAFLDRSNLAASIEPIRLTPMGMNLEGLARVWSLFSFQSKFALALVYQASMLFVDADDLPRTALPVKTTNVYVDAGGPPVIDSVFPTTDATGPVTPGAALSITGSGFGTKPSDVQVVLDGNEIPTTSVTPTLITFTLSATLPAGTHRLQVARPRLMGSPPEPHQGLLSNSVAIVLQPAVVGASVFFVVGSPTDPTDDLPPETIDGVTVVSGHIRVTVDPLVEARQQVAIFLNELQVTAGPTARAYTVPVGARDPASVPSPTVTAQFRRVVPGTYLVRVQVDGATSALIADPTTGQFINPVVQVTLPP